MKMRTSALLAFLCLGVSVTAFSQEQQPLNLTARPTLEGLMSAGMHSISSSDQTHSMEPMQTESESRRVVLPAGLNSSPNNDKEVAIPKQELEMGRSLYSGPVNLRLATGEGSVIEYSTARMIAYFPSEEVTIDEDLFPPTPMVTKGSQAREINFWSINRTTEDLKVLAKLIEATALNPESFTAWVNKGVWKHAPEYSRQFETAFGELSLHVTSDGLVTTDGELHTGKRAALKGEDIKDAKLRFYLSVIWRDKE